MYEEIEEKYKDLIWEYEDSTLRHYIHNILENKQINFFKDYFFPGPKWHIDIFKNEIFDYIPLTQENVIIFIERLKYKYPFWSFHANIVFNSNQISAFNYIKEFLKIYKIPLIFVLNGLNSVLISEFRNALIYDNISKDKFFVPINVKATATDILDVLRTINTHYKNFKHDYGYRGCQTMIEYLYNMQKYLQDNQLFTDLIKYEFLKLKKDIFVQCSKAKIDRKRFFCNFYNYDKTFLKQFLTDYYLIFHKKKHKPKINDFINTCIFKYSEKEKNEINNLLNNLFIPFKKFQLFIFNFL